MDKGFISDDPLVRAVLCGVSRGMLPVARVAEILGISRRTVVNYVKDGRLRAIEGDKTSSGRASWYKIPATELARFMERRSGLRLDD